MSSWFFALLTSSQVPYELLALVYCYQFYHATLGDQAFLVKGIIDVKTVFSVTPLRKCIFPHLLKKKYVCNF